MPCLGQRRWAGGGEGAVGRTAGSWPQQVLEEMAAASRGAWPWSGACPAARWRLSPRQPGLLPWFPALLTARWACLGHCPQPRPHTFLAGHLPRQVLCPSPERAFLRRGGGRQGFPSIADSKALWSQSVPTGAGVLLALPADVPDDCAAGARVCSSGGCRLMWVCGDSKQDLCGRWRSESCP